MIAVPISVWVLAWFKAQQFFFLFAMPFAIGFVVAVLYPVGQRMAARHAQFLKVMMFSGLAPAAMLFGWTLVVRTQWTALPYGMGYGLGVACLSRVHKLQLWPPRILTRRQAARQ